ncbi:peptidoglycan bridge formation glycyltransferase FemA/FemB family protein [Virgibacillus dokdonensis]|uniref:Lipid II:glycine glycyltransferase n=1 Tax=Virgibacillus dokdonensis TaxID=302167 RepID=A0A2K9J6J4_9BACI|nr:peptidoglycan bridge formation glycyltransferase FemA/FemB family protein [Virgibacillus dokdonensis]AUJ24840.1 FemAB family protein [Virgibacillus dokdonensis]
MKAKIISNKQKWNNIILENNGTVFHLYEWGKLMEYLPYVTFYPTILEDGNNQVYIPIFEQNQRISASLLGYGGPVIVGNKQIELESIQEIIFSHFGNYITNLLIPHNSNTISTYNISSWRGKTTYLLSLPQSYEEIWNSCSGKARTSVRYSIKQGVEVRKLSRSELKTFYHLYLEHAKTVGSSYIINYELFVDCFEKLSDNSLFLGAYKDSQLVSSSVFLYDHYAMYYWININNHLGKKMQASYQIMEFALKSAVEYRLKVMDFGYSHTKEIAKPKIYWGAKTEHCPILK